MPQLTVTLLDAARQPLEAQVDIRVRETETDVLAGRLRMTSTRALFEVLDRRVYLLQVYPRGYRPVQQFVPIRGDTALEICCPVDPAHVVEVRFPPVVTLSDELTRKVMWTGLTTIQRAGVLNLYAKLWQTRIGDRRAWSYLSNLYRVRGDRIFADVETGFRDRVKDAVTEGWFREVSGVLHTPPPGYELAGSFKSDDQYGSLQVTFFCQREPLAFRADIDIDDAGGIAHLFHVIGHHLSGGETHPYDIHEILLMHQGIDPGYTLMI